MLKELACNLEKIRQRQVLLKNFSLAVGVERSIVKLIVEEVDLHVLLLECCEGLQDSPINTKSISGAEIESILQVANKGFSQSSKPFTWISFPAVPMVESGVLQKEIDGAVIKILAERADYICQLKIRCKENLIFNDLLKEALISKGCPEYLFHEIFKVS